MLSAVLLAGCNTAPSRPAVSAYGCMQAARAAAPPLADDKQQHCVTSALIAQQCSRMEAWMAGIGKELDDLFGAGDAQWSDWQADRAGVRCGQQAGETAALISCCERASY